MRHVATAQQGSTLRTFLAVMAVAAAIAGFEFYALRKNQLEPLPAVEPAAMPLESCSSSRS